MKFKNRDLRVFLKVAFNLSSKEANPKFHYALRKNVNSIFKAQEELERNLQDEEYEQYLREVDEIMVGASNKNENGTPKFKDSAEGRKMYDIPEDKMPEVEKAVGDLEVKYKTTIDRMKDKVDKHKQFMEEEIEFEYYKCSMDFVPNITGPELEVITPMLLDVE